MSHNNISSSFNCRVLAIKQPAASPQLRTQTSAATTPDTSTNLDFSLSQIEIDRLEWDSSFQLFYCHYLPATMIYFSNDEQIYKLVFCINPNAFSLQESSVFVQWLHTKVCILSNMSYVAVINSWDTSDVHKICNRELQVHYHIVGPLLTNTYTIMNGLQSPWYSFTENSISNLPKPVCNNMEIKEVKKKG